MRPDWTCLIEIADGRWGASLEIDASPHLLDRQRRPTPPLLYDLWRNRMCLPSVHAEHPDLIEK
jgi:hypothetical protein